MKGEEREKLKEGKKDEKAMIRDLKSHLNESAKKLGFMIRPRLFRLPLILSPNEIDARTFYLGIFISKGALEKLDKEGQFAILDHELGHITGWKEDVFLIFYFLLPLIALGCTYFGKHFLYALPFIFLFAILRSPKLVDYMANLKIKSELGADRITAELGNTKALISVLKKENKEQSYSWVSKFIFKFYFSNCPSYPSLAERIKKLEEFLE